jgi:hypothetical protein
MEQLQRKIFSMESQTIERRPDGKLFPPIQQDTNVKDFGLLMDLVTFEEEEEEQQFLIWKNALSMILEKHLLHRICLDQEMALQILKANGNKQSLTIWPLKSLQINANKRPLDRVFPIIEKELGSKNVKDPLSLVKMNTLYHQHHTLLSKCLFKGNS